MTGDRVVVSFDDDGDHAPSAPVGDVTVRRARQPAVPSGSPPITAAPPSPAADSGRRRPAPLLVDARESQSPSGGRGGNTGLVLAAAGAAAVVVGAFLPWVALRSRTGDGPWRFMSPTDAGIDALRTDFAYLIVLGLIAGGCALAMARPELVKVVGWVGSAIGAITAAFVGIKIRQVLAFGGSDEPGAPLVGSLTEFRPGPGLIIMFVGAIAVIVGCGVRLAQIYRAD